MAKEYNRAGMTWPEMLVLCLILIVTGLIISSAAIRSFDVPLLKNGLEDEPSVSVPPIETDVPVTVEKHSVPRIKTAAPAVTAPSSKHPDDNEKKGYTAIHVAVAAELSNVVRMVSREKEINKPSANGMTPLALACQKGNLEIVEILLKAGANVKAGAIEGHAPILEAVRNKFHLIAARLLKAGADIKTTDSKGFSLLHIAAEKGCEPMLKLLVKKGMSVNVTVPDSHKYYAGKTPLDFALGSGNMEAVGYLVSQGAKRGSALP